MKLSEQTTILFLWCFSSFVTPYAVAESLEVSVQRALQTNPQMSASIQDYLASKAQVNIAMGNFLPQVNLIVDGGRETIELEGQPETDLDRRNVELELRLPLFKGFANVEQRRQADLGQKAAYYLSLERAERLALQLSKAYLDVLRSKEIVILSLENLNHHEKTFDLVHARQNQGVADKADLSQIRGRLARSRANLLSARNNLRDAETTYFEISGIAPTTLIRPKVDKSYLPNSNEQALEIAMANSQSVFASNFSAKSLSAAAKSLDSHYYPEFDLVASRVWRDETGGFYGTKDESRILLEMKWNLFSGGQKSNQHKKALYQAESAKMRTSQVLRETKANVDSSWSAYRTLEKEIIYLQEYVKQTKETEKLYAVQFNVGRRSLLDLLDSQNELFQSRKAYVAADYDYVYAQYRVIASMSYILDALHVNVMEGLSNES
jgi:adhesin transport system outer membrane protein